MVQPKTEHEIELLKAYKYGLIEKIEVLLSLHSIQKDERYFDYHLVIKALDDHEIEIAKLLLEKGFRVYKNPKSNRESTVLHAAVESDNTCFIESLLDKGALPDILTFNKKNKTPFHLAIDSNQSSIIELFLSKFDAEAYDEKYVLHYAIENNNVHVVLQLIAKGLSLKKKTEKNLTPYCVALKKKNYKILDFLLSHCTVQNIKVDFYDDIAPAYIASYQGDLKLLKKYVVSGICINSPLKSSSDSWSSLDDYPGFTLLHFAVQQIKLEVVEYLLSLGADIFIQSKSTLSPLHIAFEAKEIGLWKTQQDFYDNNSIIDLILKVNTKFKSNPITAHGLSHFHVACSQDDPTVVERFLKHSASINQSVNSECSTYKNFAPLHFAAKFRCVKTIKVLLINGADVKQRDYKEMTALHIAAEESCLETVSLLLQYSVDIGSVDSHGKTPLHLAFEKKNYRIMDLLLSVPYAAFSNPTDINGVSHFHIACTRNNVKVVKSFIEKGVCLDTRVPAKSDVNENTNPDWSGCSPLHFAVCHNKSKIVQLLLHSGANVGIKNSKGFIPLHIACRYTSEMFEEFIKNILIGLSKLGKITQDLKPIADIPIIHAEQLYKLSGSIKKIDWLSNRAEHMKIINLLLNNESDVNCLDNDKNTPVLYAYLTVTNTKRILEYNQNYSVSIRNQIAESLTKELYERRKLILSNLLKLDVNLDECFSCSSILHCIISNYDEDQESDAMMKLFLEKGASVDAKFKITNEQMHTPLLRAIQEERNDIVRILLEYNANVDYIVDSRNNATLLLIASTNLSAICTGIFDSLIAKSANVNARLSDGTTVFHNLALTCRDLFILRYEFKYCEESLYTQITQVVSHLIKAGVNINGRDIKGLTPIHLACKEIHCIITSIFLKHGADINIEDNLENSPCCNLYHGTCHGINSEDLFAMGLVSLVYSYIVKTNVIGLPVGTKALSSISKCHDLMPLLWKQSEEEQREFLERCRTEVQTLRDAKINHNYTLYDMIFKTENSLSQLVKNRLLKAIVESKSFKDQYPQYGDLVKLKYQAGVDRGNLLPKAKCVLNELAGLPLPDICSENICRYFNNAELKESTEILRGLLDLKMEKSEGMQLRSSKMLKRRKVN